MKPLHPYRVTVYNRAAQQNIGEFYANQVPQRGDLLAYHGDRTQPGDAYHGWPMWQVDAVMWEIAHPGSVTAREIARESDGYPGSAFCVSAEIHVWPAQGPHWYETPEWAKAVTAPDDEEEEDET